MQQAEISLRQTAATVASIVDDNETAESTSELLKDILPKGTNALIAISHVEVSFAMQEGLNKRKFKILFWQINLSVRFFNQMNQLLKK